MNAAYRIITRDIRKKTAKGSVVLFDVSDGAGSPKITEAYLKNDTPFSFSRENGHFLILPVHGQLVIAGSTSQLTLFPSQYTVASLNGNYTIEGEEELSRFFLFEFDESSSEVFTESYSTEVRNKLQMLTGNENYNLQIGIFDGRKDAEYRMSKPNAVVTCVNGAFEFQNRLIETCDSLIINNDSLLEMEALSENAILLILEY